MSSIVLITTANNPPENIPFLEMTNIATRFITAKASVFFWAANGINEIVIADATGSYLLDNNEVILLNQMGVNVEQISYKQNNDLIKIKGKGYGEGELINFAINNSVLLKKQKSFFKCTGKVYCRNFDAITEMINQNKLDSIFWRHLGEGDSIQLWADMRFFYTTHDFFEDNLLPAYLKSDDSKASIEHFCYEVLNTKLKSAKGLRPQLSGFAGGSGKRYFDSSLGALDTNYPCWIASY